MSNMDRIQELAHKALALDSHISDCQEYYMKALFDPNVQNTESKFDGAPWYKVLLEKLEMEERLDIVEKELTDLLKNG